MKRLLLQVTYQCTSRCAHCLYYSTDQSRQAISRECLERVIDQTRPSEAVLFTGGEASIEPDLVLHGMAYANQLGIDSWLVTNGSWGKDADFARRFAAQMVASGLTRVNCSVDAFHQAHIPFAWVTTALTVCQDAGVKTIKAMVTFINRGSGIAQDDQTEALLRQLSQMGGVALDIRPRVGFAGRAVSALRAYAPTRPWADVLLDEPCDHNMLESSYYTVGPEGKVFICSGFAFPGSVQTTAFRDIVCQVNVDRTPIVRAFQQGGIRGLCELAMRHGYRPREFYCSGCHLCLEARRHLRSVYPECLVPEHAYGESADTARNGRATQAKPDKSG
jgi:hypothetical protein